MNVINTHLPWPQPSLKSNTPPPPRILAVRDTVDIDGAFFLPFIASTWVSSHRNASTECSLHWVSCGAETHQDVESTLSKYSCALKFGSSPLVQFVDVTQAVTSGEVDAGDPSYLKQVYSNISLHVSSAQTPSNSPILVVIDDASFLSTMFPKPDVLNFLNYLFALSHSSENLSVVFRVGADSALSIPSTSIVNVAGVRAGAVDCKHIGLGGVVGTSSDVDSSAFDVAKEESPSTPTPSTRGDFSTLGQIGSPSGFSRHADIVCDFTPLPSGFSREAYGNLKIHHVPSSRSPAAPPLSLNYQILDSGIIKAAKV
ncbi:hypothetical protein TrLO_g14337 [Triparma laevis f. longispina]|uniref:Uncharacterized protein n=1 Tax=Triparma laevis f. longispina TaxID=1714387 RepID=A0A9W6ZTS5_9STRA|nr:hypothetical protein TrLO_g14337 [Triparma laevis f. longispina]